MAAPFFPRVVDSSMRSEFVACPERFRNSFIKNLQPKGDNVHLKFGKVYAVGHHKFRQFYYGIEGSDLPETVRFDRACARAMEAMIIEWGDFRPPENSKKTFDSCVACMESYLAQYPPALEAMMPIIAADGKPMTEFTFALPTEIGHPQLDRPILYAGRFDGLFRFKASDDGAAYVLDDKTAGSLGMLWANNWRLRSQLTGYKWAAEQYGYNVQGIIVRGVAPLVRGPVHQQVIEQRPHWMVERWWTQLQRDIRRMVEFWDTYGPDNTWDQAFDHACADFGGCAFVQLCTTPNPDAWVDEYYTPRDWNPLEGDVK